MRAGTDHLLTRRDHASNKRFPVLPVARPVPRSQDQFGDLPEACPCRAGVRGVECPELVSQLKMIAGDDPLTDEGANNDELLFEATIVRQLETQGSRTRQHGALDDVQSERHAIAIDQHVFAGQAAN